MALGRPRASKRSSSSSYASTVTTVVFLTLCLFGVWMLTSNSVVPPQNTTRTSSNTATATTTDLTSTSGETQLQLPKSEEKEATPAFEDNPGDLPLDAIKSDDNNVVSNEAKSRDDGSKESARDGSGGNEAQLSEESAMTQSQVEASQKTEEKLDLGGSQEQNTNLSDQINESTTENKESDNNKSSKEALLEINAQEQPQQQLPEEPQNNVGPKEIQQVTTEEQQPQQQEATDILENSADSQNDQLKPEIEGEKVPQESEIRNQDEENAQQIQQQQQQDNLNMSNNTEDITSLDQNEPQQQEQDNSNTSSNKEDTASTEQNEPQKKQQHSENPMEDQESLQTQSEESQEIPKDSKTETKEVETTTAGSLETSGIRKESKESKNLWSTQAAQSENEKDRRREESTSNGSIYGYRWELCNVTAGPDYIPCLDNEKALKKLRSTHHFEHRERHCPEEGPTCLVPRPEGYKRSIGWPNSRNKIWYHNIPHTKLAKVKGHQNWVKVTGEFLTFPGGGTQFIHGALHYIDFRVLHGGRGHE